MSQNRSPLAARLEHTRKFCALGEREFSWSPIEATTLTLDADITAQISHKVENWQHAGTHRAKTHASRREAETAANAEGRRLAADAGEAERLLGTMVSTPRGWLRSRKQDLGKRYEATTHEGCPKCASKGEVRCGTCKGKGENTCGSCHGSGNTGHCGACHGTGKHWCFGCHGTRTVSVYVPNPGGGGSHNNVSCPDCWGSGRSLSVPCGYCRNGRIDCSACKTEGKVRCKPCSGSGKVTCPTCEGHRALTIGYTTSLSAAAQVRYGLVKPTDDHVQASADPAGAQAIIGHRDMALTVTGSGPGPRMKVRGQLAMSACDVSAAAGQWRLRAIGSAPDIVATEPILDEVLAEEEAALGTLRGASLAGWVQQRLSTPLGREANASDTPDGALMTSGGLTGLISEEFLSGYRKKLGKAVNRLSGANVANVWFLFLFVAFALGLSYHWTGFELWVRAYVNTLPRGTDRNAMASIMELAPYGVLWLAFAIPGAVRGHRRARLIGYRRRLRHVLVWPLLMLVLGVIAFAFALALGVPQLGASYGWFGEVQSALRFLLPS